MKITNSCFIGKLLKESVCIPYHQCYCLWANKWPLDRSFRSRLSQVIRRWVQLLSQGTVCLPSTSGFQWCSWETIFSELEPFSKLLVLQALLNMRGDESSLALSSTYGRNPHGSPLLRELFDWKSHVLLATNAERARTWSIPVLNNAKLWSS